MSRDQLEQPKASSVASSSADDFEAEYERAIADFVANLKTKPESKKLQLARRMRKRTVTPSSPDYVAIPHSDTPFDFTAMIDVHWSVFKEIFPPFNLEVPLVVRGTTGCWPVLAALNSKPEMADLITNIDFIDYNVDWILRNGQRKQLEIVRLCKNLSTVTIDVDIDDCCVYETLEDGRGGWRSTGLTEIKGCYDFNRLCLDRSRDHKKRFDNLNLRFKGVGLTWKRQFANGIINELKYNLGKKGLKVKVLEEYAEKIGRDGVVSRVLKATGLTDPYVGRAPTSKTDDENDAA